MNEPTPSRDSSHREIYAGLALGVAIGIALNAATYFLFAAPSAEDAAKFHLPQLHRLGFPRTFWIENRVGAPSFYWGAFLLDVVATLGLGIALAQWLEKRARKVPPAEEPDPSKEDPQ